MQAGRYACVTVSDTGTGIDQFLIDKIFEPHFTTKELGKGTGLGLSVVHGIVKEHGGDIRVYSEVDKGTTFYVFLPLLEEGIEKNAKISRKYPTGTERILLVDDEATIARMVQTMLERLGYQVTTRTSSLDALDTFRVSPSRFDMVISDRGMPNMTGEQLAGELLLIKPDIPIIICTGFSDENAEQQAKSIPPVGTLAMIQRNHFFMLASSLIWSACLTALFFGFFPCFRFPRSSFQCQAETMPRPSTKRPVPVSNHRNPVRIGAH